MVPIHTILHPTDFSDRSRHALNLACALARVVPSVTAPVTPPVMDP